MRPRNPYGSSSDFNNPNYNNYNNYGYNYPPPQKKPPKIIQMTKRSFILMIVIILALASLISFGGMTLANYYTGSGTSSSSKITGTGYKLENATNSKMTVQDINAKVKDSVVEITTESSEQGGWVGEYVTQGAGSGVVIKSNGYIMTNNHVISGASNITVKVDGKSYKAKVVGVDSENDVAVLKINATRLKAVTYGNSDQIDVGDMAVVIGNPLGTLGGSVSAGIISATNRKITLENQTMELIQTDASVNPGNSGGGMFNGDGQLIGLVVAKSSGENVEGLGFAIPINVAAKSASNIMKGKGDSTTTQDQNNSTDNSQQYDNGNGYNDGGLGDLFNMFGW
ncbi:MAG: S1C family serine protease [Anaerovoracaceae bacterium]|jgi:serine protease Do